MNTSIYDTCSQVGSVNPQNESSVVLEMMLCISDSLQSILLLQSASNNSSDQTTTVTTNLSTAVDSSNPINDTNDYYSHHQQQQQQNTTTSNPSSENYDLIRPIALLLVSSLMFFMQAGFAMLCAGSVRGKNVQNTLVKNMLDACGSAVAFFCIGYAFAFGGDDMSSYSNWIHNTNNTTTFIGTSNFFLINVEDLSFWFFQYTFSATATTIVAGALAERCQMAAYLSYSIVLAGWVYPLVAHTIWSPHGYLCAHKINPLWGTGMIDFSGSGVVHVTGGLTALFAAKILGPRCGRFHDDDGRPLHEPRKFIGSSVSLQMLGTFILWFGWYGFNSGNAILIEVSKTTTQIAALAAVNTTLSAGFGGLVSTLINLWWVDRITGEGCFDVKFAMNGVLSGLVASAGCCGIIEPWAASIVGCFAGIGYNCGTRLLIRYRIDDAVDAIPVHLLSGILGIISAGLLASPKRLLAVYGRNNHAGLLYTGDFVLIGTQLVGLVFIFGCVLCFMVPFFILLDFNGWFRSDPLEEIVGLDTSYHGGLALLTSPPDHDRVSDAHLAQFQQQRLDARNQRLQGFLNNVQRSESAKEPKSSSVIIQASDDEKESDEEGTSEIKQGQGND